jgi:hypothetical protein
MYSVMSLLKAIPILVAAFFLGNWFLSEVKKAKMTGKAMVCALPHHSRHIDPYHLHDSRLPSIFSLTRANLFCVLKKLKTIHCESPSIVH